MRFIKLHRVQPNDQATVIHLNADRIVCIEPRATGTLVLTEHTAIRVKENAEDIITAIDALNYVGKEG